MDKVKELRDKKEKSVLRRQMRKVHESNDQEVRIMLEQERREYMLQLSLEQRDDLYAAEREIMSRQQSKAVDAAILDAVQQDLLIRSQQHKILLPSQTLSKSESHADDVAVVNKRITEPPNVLSSPSSTLKLADGASSEPAEKLSLPAFVASTASSTAATAATSSLTKKENISAGSMSPSTAVSLNKSIVSIPASSSFVAEEKRASSPFQSTSSPAQPPQVPHDTSRALSSSPSEISYLTQQQQQQQDMPTSGTKVEAPAMALYWLTEHLTLVDCGRMLGIFFEFLESLPGTGINSDLVNAYNSADIESLLLSTASDLLSSAISKPITVQPYVVASTVLVILTEVGFQLFPKEVLNGVVTLDKVQKALKKLGGGRLELLNVILDHLSTAVAQHLADADEMAGIFTARITHFVDDEGDNNVRVQRKVHKLLQLAAVSSRSPRNRSKSPTSPTSAMGKSSASASISLDLSESKEVQTRSSIQTDIITSAKSSSLASIGKVATNNRAANKFSKSFVDDFEDLDDVDTIGAPPPVRDLADLDSTKTEDDLDEFS
jgi:hypothetical protein